MSTENEPELETSLVEDFLRRGIEIESKPSSEKGGQRTARQEAILKVLEEYSR